MADESGSIISHLDKLRAVQSKEKKELQAKIMALKNGIPKDDKKKKRELAQQIETLEEELTRRHEIQLRECSGQNQSNSQQNAQEEQTNGDLDNETASVQPAAHDDESAFFFKDVKLSKTQAKKEKKKNQRSAASAIARESDEKNAQFSPGNIEKEAFQRVLQQRALGLVEIAPDGDCLYNALAHQIRSSSRTLLASDLREIAAKYIRRRKDEFLPFLLNSDGEPLDEFEFDEYCAKVGKMCAQGGSWGGEPEIRALSSSLENRIDVLHANGNVIAFGEDFEGKRPPLIITFHKYAYSLGEHYNSTTAIDN